MNDVAEAIAWIGGAPAQWLVGADSALGPALERAGCRPERTAVFMAREARAGERARDDAATVRDAGASGDAAAARDIVAIRDPAMPAPRWPPSTSSSRRTRGGLLASLGFDGPLRHYAAVRDGAPVGIASTFAWRETVTLTQLAVAPAWRRQGIGRALVQHVAHGLTLLSPTPATMPFYTELGFRLLRYPPDRVFYLPV